MKRLLILIGVFVVAGSGVGVWQALSWSGSSRVSSHRSAGANLPAGNWDIRGQAGGWTVNNGNRLTFKNSGAAQVGSVTATCNS